MTIGILATGDEIVHGDTLNTNTYNIAQSLSSEGLPLGIQMSCSDKKRDIVACLSFLVEKHNIICMIGGLGPTTDDLTRFALAQFLQVNMVQHNEALLHIKNRLKVTTEAINEGNLQQCLFPEKATLLPNPNGTAMGCYYQSKGTIFILLPGPPQECLPMFTHFTLPLLQKTQHSSKQILKWRIFGAAESEIGETLERALADLDCQTGYRLEMPYIEFKVRCRSDLIERIKSIIDPIVAPYVIATTDKKASEQLRELILNKNLPIHIIDEVTGGLLQSVLSTPELNLLLNFHSMNKPFSQEAAKQPLQESLSFHLQGLAEYWSGQTEKRQTQLTIRYSNPHQKGEETHTLPFRSPLVVLYAVEWLSFRLFHLINQLHQ